MPSAPKWVADLMEDAFSSKLRKVQVTEISYLSDHLKLVRFSGDFSAVKFKLGQAVVLRVNDTNFRNYTPCFWDSGAGICDVLFHLHGNGPGSKFIATLNPGDLLTLGLPRGFNLYRKESNYHFFFGDETTLGLFKSIKEAVDQQQQHYIGVFELDQESAAAVDKLELMIDIVPKSSNRAEHAIDFLSKLDATLWQLWKAGSFYLMGNAKSIQQFRKALRAMGVSNSNIVTQPFWADGKTGL